jgi:hypothetical protein
MLLALILLPLRKTFLEEKHGYWKLGLLFLGLSLLSTIGPTPGSFDGYIFTTIPVLYQIHGYPEAILYISLFIGILSLSYKQERKWITVLSILFVLIICAMSAMGYLLVP